MKNSRDKILSALKKADKTNFLSQEKMLESDSAFFPAFKKPLINHFQEEFEAINGVFHLCNDVTDFKQQLSEFQQQKKSEIYCIDENIQKLAGESISFASDKASFLNQKIGITTCESLVARTGSIVVSSRNISGRRMIVYPPIHLVVAFANQLKGELSEAINQLIESTTPNIPSLISTITGPSRTADIEKTLILGAHGPKELHLFFVNKR